MPRLVEIVTFERNVNAWIVSFTYLRLGTSGDQCRVSCPQFAVAMDTFPGQTTEQGMAFYHQ
jgi:hypothetical protein